MNGREKVVRARARLGDVVERATIDPKSRVMSRLVCNNWLL